MDATTAYIVDYAMQIDYARLAPATVAACKDRLLDTLGCALGAYEESICIQSRELAREHGGRVTASVIGGYRDTTPEMAAFANGVMMRFLDMNDMYRKRSGGHPSDVLAAVLAVAEAVRADGRTFIAAVALAYEIFCSFCDSIDINSAGWDQPIYGTIASSLACATLMKLPRERLGHAVSLALVPNMALMQTRRGQLSSWKGCAAANGSRNAVFAAMLAGKGFAGPGEAFEGRDGLWRIVGKFDWATLEAGAGADRITRTHLKSFAIGYHGQSAAWAALDLRDRVSVENIETITIETYGPAVDMMGSEESRWSPTTRETADHSLPYVVAVVLLNGTIDEESFSEQKLNEPRVRELMGKIRVVEDPALSARYPVAAPCRISAITNGKTTTVLVDHPKGHVMNPLSKQEIEGKFHKLSQRAMHGSKAAALIQCIDDLESLDDVGDLLKVAGTQS